jgi:hypothetical protein
MYLRYLESRGYAAATISRRFGTVATFYKFAVIDAVIPADPQMRLPARRGEAGGREPDADRVQFGCAMPYSRTSPACANTLIFALVASFGPTRRRTGCEGEDQSKREAPLPSDSWASPEAIGNASSL